MNEHEDLLVVLSLFHDFVVANLIHELVLLERTIYRDANVGLSQRTRTILYKNTPDAMKHKMIARVDRPCESIPEVPGGKAVVIDARYTFYAFQERLRTNKHTHIAPTKLILNAVKRINKDMKQWYTTTPKSLMGFLL